MLIVPTPAYPISPSERLGDFTLRGDMGQPVRVGPNKGQLANAKAGPEQPSATKATSEGRAA